jgi:hypothetical protein
VNRDYTEGISNTVKFFTGFEIEHTPAYNKKTLFVVGVQPQEKIKKYYELYNCEHIFFGANQSFHPGTDFPKDAEEWNSWENMITPFLKNEIWCSLDIPINCAEAFLETGLTEYNTFIPQISVPIPYIKLWNYNTMLKIDDKDFKATNPGVWTYNLHDLMNRDKFTNWTQYKLDTRIE